MVTSAATFTLSPSTGAFAPGDTFSVIVYANPTAGEEITVGKLSATFSADTLELVSFVPYVGWMPLVAPGSDLIDNTTGKLIKTSGYPARLTESKQFGTATFKAKSDGVGTITIEGDSMFLDVANANKYTASAGATFAITTPTPPPAPITTPTPAPSPAVPESVTVNEEATQTPAEEEVTIEEEEEIVNEEAVVEDGTETQVAAVAGAGDGSEGGGNLWYYLLAIIAVLAGVFSWRRFGNKTS